jgi:hypothetical protein
MQKECPQISKMSECRVKHNFPWGKFIAAEQLHIAGLRSAPRKYSDSLLQIFHDEIIVHNATVANRDKNGKLIREADGYPKTFTWKTEVSDPQKKGPVHSFPTHGRHFIDLSGRPDDLSKEQNWILWNVEAMLGRMGNKRLDLISSAASSSGAKAPGTTKPQAQQSIPIPMTSASTPASNAAGKRKAAETPAEAIRVQEVAEDDGMVIFAQPGIREGMADADLLLSVCYTDASGETVSHEIPTNQTFQFILRKKARKSTIKAGVLQLTG